MNSISVTMAFSSLFHVTFLDKTPKQTMHCDICIVTINIILLNKTKNRLCIVTINIILLNKTKNRLYIVTIRFWAKTLSLVRLALEKMIACFHLSISLWAVLTQQARLSVISSSMSAHSSLNADSSSFCSAFLAPLRASLFAAFLHTMNQICG